MSATAYHVGHSNTITDAGVHTFHCAQYAVPLEPGLAGAGGLCGRVCAHRIGVAASIVRGAIINCMGERA